MANLLTALRILLVLPFAATFYWDSPAAMKAAFVIFALAAATDFFDGAVARARRETSALGAALDPVADKILVAAALVLLVRNGVIAGYGALAALAVIAREMLVAGLREALAGDARRLAVTGLAKFKTAAQLVAVGALLLGAPGGFAPGAFPAIGAGLLWLAALLTLTTGASYVSAAVSALRTSAAPPEAK
jgi:CDP-diacylglycerol--glycerol-3-phosphate 3-phosphatidyltransferase